MLNKLPLDPQLYPRQIVSLSRTAPSRKDKPNKPSLIPTADIVDPDITHYSVKGSIIGLGTDILLEILHANQDWQDAKTFVGLNKTTFSLMTNRAFDWASSTAVSRNIHLSEIPAGFFPRVFPLFLQMSLYSFLSL